MPDISQKLILHSLNGGKGELCPKFEINTGFAKSTCPQNVLSIRQVMEEGTIESPYAGRDFVQFRKTKSVLNKGAQEDALLFNPPSVLSLEIIPMFLLFRCLLHDCHGSALVAIIIGIIFCLKPIHSADGTHRHRPLSHLSPFYTTDDCPSLPVK